MKMTAWSLKKRPVWPNSNRQETFQDFIEVLSGLWLALLDERKSQIEALTSHIVDSVGELTPGMGIMKGLMSLLKGS